MDSKMVKNIYRCENCWLRLCCFMPETNGYCQDFVLDETRISEEQHIYYKIQLEYDRELVKAMREFYCG